MTEVGGAERQDVSPEVAQATSDGLSNDRQFARVTHHDPPSFHPVRLAAQPLVLTHLSDRHSFGGSPGESVQGVNRGTSDDAVIRKAHILLELLDCLVSTGSENSVDPVWVETELAKPALELGHVIAPHHRVAVVEEAIPEAMVGFHESVPSLRAADPVNHQPPVPLKATQRSLGLGAEFVRVSVGVVADQGQAALKIANGFAGVAVAKWQTLRLASSGGLWYWSWHAAAAPGRD